MLIIDFALLNDAINFASEALSGVVRKRSPHIPYIIHPYRVAAQLLVEGIQNSKIIIASILHDVLEESQFISRHVLDNKFGKEITSLVVEMTDPKTINDKSTLEKYKIHRIKNYSSPEATLISLSDKTDNLRDLYLEFNTGLVKDVSHKELYYTGMLSAYEDRQANANNPVFDKILMEYKNLVSELWK